MPDIIVQSSMLSSVLPKKNPTAHSNGLSIDTANASATTLFDCKTHLLQLFQHQMFPYLFYLDQIRRYLYILVCITDGTTL